MSCSLSLTSLILIIASSVASSGIIQGWLCSDPSPPASIPLKTIPSLAIASSSRIGLNGPATPLTE